MRGVNLLQRYSRSAAQVQRFEARLSVSGRANRLTTAAQHLSHFNFEISYSAPRRSSVALQASLLKSH